MTPNCGKGWEKSMMGHNPYTFQAPSVGTLLLFNNHKKFMITRKEDCFLALLAPRCGCVCDSRLRIRKTVFTPEGHLHGNPRRLQRGDNCLFGRTLKPFIYDDNCTRETCYYKGRVQISGQQWRRKYLCPNFSSKEAKQWYKTYCPDCRNCAMSDFTCLCHPI